MTQGSRGRTVISTFLIRGSSTIHFPVCRPYPGSTFNTPDGTRRGSSVGMSLVMERDMTRYLQLPQPFLQIQGRLLVLASEGSQHVSKLSDNQQRFLKLTSEGLTMTLFPAASAGAIFLIAINSGWLNG